MSSDSQPLLLRALDVVVLQLRPLCLAAASRVVEAVGRVGRIAGLVLLPVVAA